MCYRLQDLFQQEKGRKRPSVPPSPGRLRQGDENKVMDFDHCNYIFKTAAEVEVSSRNTVFSLQIKYYLFKYWHLHTFL